jgi:hypothetical protein
VDAPLLEHGDHERGHGVLGGLSGQRSALGFHIPGHWPQISKIV